MITSVQNFTSLAPVVHYLSPSYQKLKEMFARPLCYVIVCKNITFMKVAYFLYSVMIHHFKSLKMQQVTLVLLLNRKSVADRRKLKGMMLGLSPIG